MLGARGEEDGLSHEDLQCSQSMNCKTGHGPLHEETSCATRLFFPQRQNLKNFRSPVK